MTTPKIPKRIGRHDALVTLGRGERTFASGLVGFRSQRRELFENFGFRSG